MTLRPPGRETVAMTGPRSRAVAAPQTIGKRALAPGSGCDVRRICSVRLEPVIAISLNDVGAPLPTRLTILRPHDVGVPAQVSIYTLIIPQRAPAIKTALRGGRRGCPLAEKMVDNSTSSLASGAIP